MLNKKLDNFEIFRANKYSPITINNKDYNINQQPYLDVVVTDRCNRKCKFCIADLVENKEQCKIRTTREQIDYAIENYNVKELLFVGGEPTIFSGLFDILDYFAVGPDFPLKKICITTNGDMLKKQKFRTRLFNSVTHVNLSLMHTDIQKQANIADKNVGITINELKEIYTAAKEQHVELRINCNVFHGNLDGYQEIMEFYNIVKDYCDSVKFSPLLRVDDYSVVNEVVQFVKDNILSDEEYEQLFKNVEAAYCKYPIVRNPLTFGFVEYSMICAETPIILNYNHRGMMADKARRGYINNIKLLTNGNLSLSWNKEDKSKVIRFAKDL
jgi:molybdenum cofactor biosynthesis enzyme MoaA